VKNVGWWICLCSMVMGCNAIVGNDGQYVDKAKTNQPPAEVAGRSGIETVSAGEVGKSQHYKMVFTLGQGSPMQEKAKSSGHGMQGGLVCE